MKGGGSPALVTAKSGDDYHISSRNINRPRVVKIQLSQVVKIRLLFPAELPIYVTWMKLLF